MPAFLKSKTMWAQILSVAAMVGTLFGLDITPEDQATGLAAIVAVSALVDVVIRYLTNGPMSAKK